MTDQPDPIHFWRVKNGTIEKRIKHTHFVILKKSDNNNHTYNTIDLVKFFVDSLKELYTLLIY